ncbi:unnamed protein product [Alopecurus aequalis]
MASSVPDHFTVMPADVGKCGDAITVVDYPCVRRCRQRRLATYLWLHGFRDTLRGLLNESTAFMSAAHLSGLVRQGLWENAVLYVARFLGPVSEPRSDEANVLIHFLRQHKAFASMVAGVDNGDLKFLNDKYNMGYLRHDGSVSHDDLRIRSITLSLLNSPQVRASLDWQRVRHKASKIVYDLVFQAPELKDLALLPGGSMLPQVILPLGFRSRRRRYVKQQDLPRAKTLTKIFLWTKKRLPPSTRSLNTRLTDKTRKWLVDIIDESLQAGSLQLQSSEKKRTPVAAVSQTVNLTSHAENSEISAVINAGTSKLLSLENSNLRKHPRTEEIIFELDPHKKMQQTSGTFGEAGPVRN